MVNDTHTDASQAAATRDGGGFRATSTHAGLVDWACKHVHFTDRSARNCAEKHLRNGSKSLHGATP
jgi:hypothetical protein